MKLFAGITSNVAPGQDRGSIQAVRNMVRTHIANQNTLILLTITMRGTFWSSFVLNSTNISVICTDDIDNQGAADLAHIADSSRSRTIGYLSHHTSRLSDVVHLVSLQVF